MSPQLACLICGSETGEVTVRLVAWREPVDSRRYETLPRCVRVDDCWERVVGVNDEDWPIADGRPVRPGAPPPVLTKSEATTEPDPAWMAESVVE